MSDVVNAPQRTGVSWIDTRGLDWGSFYGLASAG